jgi:hypothetical protein
MTCYNIPTTYCTSVTGKFLPSIKEIFDKPHVVNKRRSMYVIYKWIDPSYYGDNDEENDILEKFKQMQRRRCRSECHKKWQRIKYI